MTAPASTRADGRNRALRTFVVGLATDVLAAVVLLLAPIVTAAQSWGDFQWGVMGFMLAKTVVATLFSYLLRTVLDGKGITPEAVLPPADPGPPADELGEGGFAHPIALVFSLGAWAAFGLLVVAFGIKAAVLIVALSVAAAVAIAMLPRREQGTHRPQHRAST